VAELRRISGGHDDHLRELAIRVTGGFSASRASARELFNPVAIVVPCHRVIAPTQTLTGYAGGLSAKRWLLEHEGVRLREEPKRRNDAQLSLLT